MDVVTIIIVALLVLPAIVLSALIYKKLAGQQKTDSEDSQPYLLIQQQINDLSKQISDRLDKANTTIQDGLQKSTQAIQQQFSITSKISFLLRA